MIIIPKNIDESLKKAHEITGVPLSILYAVAYVESRFNPTAVSPAGAKGLMQIMPFNYKTYNLSNPFDPYQSAMVGAKMLKNLYAKFQEWPKALAGYNWGIGNVNKNPNVDQWPSNTQRYVDKVLSLAKGEFSTGAIEPKAKSAKDAFLAVLISVGFIYLLKRLLVK